MAVPSPRVAYLVNRYPAVSHTFIRREIAAVEAAGVEVLRYSVRTVEDAELVDPADRAERRRTNVLLEHGGTGLLLSLVATCMTRPLRFLRAFEMSWSAGGGPIRTRLRRLAYLAEACRLRSLLSREGAGHLHAHFGTNPAMVALLCHILGGPPFSFTVHGPEEFDRPESLALGTKMRLAAFTVAISDFGRSQLRRWGPAGARIEVIRCGVDAGFLDVSPLAVPSSPRFVCVGRLCEDKAQMLLIDAAIRLDQEGLAFELVLVGDGPLRASIERKVEAAGLREKVLLRGWMDGAGVRREIEASRALVLPSYAEGLPVVIMEALALGRPVISTYVAGIPELVRPDVDGWLVPAGSLEALVAALREALAVPAARLDEMGRAGRTIVAERHDSGREGALLAEHFRRAGA